MWATLFTWIVAVEAPALAGFDPNGGAGLSVYVVDVDGLIDAEFGRTIRRVATEAHAPDVLLIRLNTFGGRVDAAGEARDALLETEATTVALVDHRALSAGALVALACDTLLMSPGAVIGAAAPMPLAEGGDALAPSEKSLSIMRAEMRSTAEASGRSGDLAEAMVDSRRGAPPWALPGQLLTLTTEQAIAAGIADGRAAGIKGVRALLNLEAASVVMAMTSPPRPGCPLADRLWLSGMLALGLLGGGMGVGGLLGSRRGQRLLAALRRDR